jgi:O-antigen/teichoic acid export membrane protein
LGLKGAGAWSLVV